MLKWYQSLLTTRPLTTQLTTTALLFGTGDFLAQHAVEQQPLRKHDYARSARMVAYGGAVFGPAATYWYQLLQARVQVSGGKAQTVVARVLLDQLVFTPINLGVFLSSMAVLEGEPGGEVAGAGALEAGTGAGEKAGEQRSAISKAVQRARDRLDAAFVTGITKNWLVWPWVQLANFSVVPLEYRVLVVNVVALGWNCYLSYLNSGGGGNGGAEAPGKQE